MSSHGVGWHWALSRPCMALVGAWVSDHHAGWWTAHFISGLVRRFRATMFHWCAVCNFTRTCPPLYCWAIPSKSTKLIHICIQTKSVVPPSTTPPCYTSLISPIPTRRVVNATTTQLNEWASKNFIQDNNYHTLTNLLQPAAFYFTHYVLRLWVLTRTHRSWISDIFIEKRLTYGKNSFGVGTRRDAHQDHLWQVSKLHKVQ